jgi:hypothetical protein
LSILFHIFKTYLVQEPALDCALRLRAALDGDQPRHKTLIFSSAETACDELRWMVDVP